MTVCHPSPPVHSLQASPIAPSFTCQPPCTVIGRAGVAEGTQGAPCLRPTRRPARALLMMGIERGPASGPRSHALCPAHHHSTGGIPKLHLPRKSCPGCFPGGEEGAEVPDTVFYPPEASPQPQLPARGAMHPYLHQHDRPCNHCSEETSVRSPDARRAHSTDRGWSVSKRSPGHAPSISAPRHHSQLGSGIEICSSSTLGAAEAAPRTSPRGLRVTGPPTHQGAN